LEILDTPGVLWPKFEEPRTGSLLAATGAINENILDLKEIAMDTIHVIREYYPGILETEYACPLTIRTDVMLEAIAEKRHLLKGNNAFDVDRAASVFLHELRRGKLGRLTLEQLSKK
ncbi:MAG: ribosome biogenesis GTPase YlqF, partial [Solobacterium sp.]|nr:ribosome biogenesis GTPase YlqF [Solobacterium sp.]